MVKLYKPMVIGSRTMLTHVFNLVTIGRIEGNHCQRHLRDLALGTRQPLQKGRATHAWPRAARRSGQLSPQERQEAPEGMSRETP